MQRACEVCSSLAKRSALDTEPPKKRIRRVLVDDRIIALCDAHAAELRQSDASGVASVRELFAEPGGRRSLVGRRAPLDRRIFPARPEGRRRGPGRRSDDPE
jgi:hypothetical protein